MVAQHRPMGIQSFRFIIGFAPIAQTDENTRLLLTLVIDRMEVMKCLADKIGLELPLMFFYLCLAEVVDAQI